MRRPAVASPSSWSAIGDPRNTSVSNGSLGTWTTAGLTGLYTLKLTATDAAGNVTAVTVTVDLDNTDALKEDLCCQPAPK